MSRTIDIDSLAELRKWAAYGRRIHRTLLNGSPAKAQGGPKRRKRRALKARPEVPLGIVPNVPRRSGRGAALAQIPE